MYYCFIAYNRQKKYAFKTVYSDEYFVFVKQNISLRWLLYVYSIIVCFRHRPSFRCVCVVACVRVRDRGGERERESENIKRKIEVKIELIINEHE